MQQEDVQRNCELIFHEENNPLKSNVNKFKEAIAKNTGYVSTGPKDSDATVVHVLPANSNPKNSSEQNAWISHQGSLSRMN